VNLIIGLIDEDGRWKSNRRRRWKSDDDDEEEIACMRERMREGGKARERVNHRRFIFMFLLLSYNRKTPQGK